MSSIKEQIRAEIERRIKELDEQIVDIYDSKAVLRKDELQRLLSFLDTLPEQPASEGLEKEMDEMWLEYCEDVDYLVYASIARHFAEWGMNQAKKEDKL